MTSRGSDAELLARTVSGDKEAFNALLRANEDRVFAVAMRILGDRERALDATQETFLLAFRKAHQFKGKSAVSTWLYRIAVNACYDLIRKEKRRPTVSLPDYVDPVDPSAEEALDAAALRPQIRSALASIPVEFRSAIVLCDMEGMSLPDAGEILGVPTGTIKSRLFRGRRLLAEIIGNQTTGSDIQDNDAPPRP